VRIKCEICKRRIDEEEMLWVVDYNKNICTKCYEEQWKEGIYRRVMPLKCNVLDMGPK